MEGSVTIRCSSDGPSSEMSSSYEDIRLDSKLPAIIDASQSQAAVYNCVPIKSPDQLTQGLELWFKLGSGLGVTWDRANTEMSCL